MNDVPRQKLREMVAKYGPSICYERERCKGLIHDYCSDDHGGSQREVHVLIAVLDAQIAPELLNTSQSGPPAMLLSRLTNKLYQDRGIDKEAARWGVESWALAFGMTLPKPEPAPPQQTAPVLRPASNPDTITRTQTPRPNTVVRSTLPPATPITSATNNITPFPTNPISSTPRIRPTTSTTTGSQTARQQTQQIQQPYSSGASSSGISRSGASSPGAYVPMRRGSRSHSIRTFFLTALCCVVLALGARTQVYLHLPFYDGLNALFPAMVFLSAAILDGGRGFVAMLIYLGLGVIGLPVFLVIPAHVGWTIPGFLYFFNGMSGWIPPDYPYYYGGLIIVAIVGSIFRANRDMSYWVTLWVLLLGQILFAICSMLGFILVGHANIATAFQSLFPDEYAALILLLIIAIPIRLINSVQY